VPPEPLDNPIARAIYDRMPEMLPAMMESLDKAEQSGEVPQAEIDALRARAEAAWDDFASQGKLPPRERRNE
jgi:hypothetical protein